MSRRSLFLGLAVLLTVVSQASAQQLTPAWVEVGEGGKIIARVVVAAPDKCPPIAVDGATHPMVERRPIPDGFRPLCEAAIPTNAKVASVNGQSLALPKPDPSIVLAFGDTGCAIKGATVQDCNDPKKWPFEQVAASAASENADLMIHVGDYLYREEPCPVGSEMKCGNTPEGDNWEAWNADFFTPGAKLLAHVPWAFARGNHESCARSWRGWFYYLDPLPWTGACDPYAPPYVIKLGSFELVMFDSSEANLDALEEKQAATYTEELGSVHAENAWLVVHHPFWGFRNGTLGKPTDPVSLPLQEAWKRAAPKGINLMLSGHVHVFELVELEDGRPPQVVAGGGGTDLARPIPASFNGLPVPGSTVIASESLRQFGYTVLNRVGGNWRLTLKNERQNELFSCSRIERKPEKTADPTPNGNAANCSGK